LKQSRQFAATILFALILVLPGQVPVLAHDGLLPLGPFVVHERQVELDRRYREADCKVRALDIAVVEVNLAHHRENLASVLDLRENDVASRQQVILAERDVELMLKRFEQARQRAARCQREIAEQWGERPD
jgi:hypothetical protein